MITNNQIRRLREYMAKTNNLTKSADRVGIDPKTARKYLKTIKTPEELQKIHTWKTRKNPFEDIWPKIEGRIELNPGLEAKTLFEYYQKKYPGRFQDGQLRTLQRKIKKWRVLKGPEIEIYFPQEHKPGVLCQSDFTNMNHLDVTICKEPFKHIIYHFVLTYSNWETGTICFSENFQSLSSGFQNALCKLGGIPECHQTDRLSAAINNSGSFKDFNQNYLALMRHYRIEPLKIQPRKPNENGDIEQRHHRFKRALEQQLLLRGSRDFNSREEYNDFLQKLFNQLNAGRSKRFNEELAVLKALPINRLYDFKQLELRVTSASTINVNHNTYSVNSRLCGEKVTVRLYSEYLDVYYGNKKVEQIPRIKGAGKHLIQYRHIIKQLLKKPGAFENYKYKKDLFPTIRFRMTYDFMRKDMGKLRANKEYLKILEVAANKGEATVNDSLKVCLYFPTTIDCDLVLNIIKMQSNGMKKQHEDQVEICAVDIKQYDSLLKNKEVISCLVN